MSFVTTQVGQTKTIGQKLTTTNVTTLYTATADVGAIIKSVSVCSINGASDTFSLLLNDGTSDFYIFKNLAISANTTELIYDHNPILRSGWTVKAQAGTANALDVVMVIAEAAKGQGNVAT